MPCHDARAPVNGVRREHGNRLSFRELCQKLLKLAEILRTSTPNLSYLVVFSFIFSFSTKMTLEKIRHTQSSNMERYGQTTRNGKYVGLGPKIAAIIKNTLRRKGKGMNEKPAKTIYYAPPRPSLQLWTTKVTADDSVVPSPFHCRIKTRRSRSSTS